MKLVIFEWEPPPRTGWRICGYQFDELVLERSCPLSRSTAARTGPGAGHWIRALTTTHVGGCARDCRSVRLWSGFTYFLEADTEAAA